ncbi:hypothetical protein THASP1DRAFT_24668, partial [Thamnocephalis sphaerospora]
MEPGDSVKRMYANAVVSTVRSAFARSVSAMSIEEPPADVIDAVCLGCNQLIEGGSAVCLGKSVWHLQCFRCAKCGKHIETESSSLMLSDNEPVCSNCSYNCRACGQPITDEAI